MATFSGVIVPMVTPFARDEEQGINYEAGARLVERLIEAGVSGIFTFGSNGEFHVCTPEEKIAFSKFVIQQVAGRVPVYVGTGSCSTREAVQLSKDAQQIGADAVSVINPYFMKVTDAEIASYFKTVAASVDIPVLLYNIPKTTGTNIPKSVVAELARIDNVRGVKDSSGNMDNLRDYVEAVEDCDVDVLVGSDGKISDAYALGASGTVAGTANLITSTIVGLWKALETGDAEEAARLQAEVEPLRDVMHLGSTPQTLKRAMELSGCPVGPARRPVGDTAPEVDEKVRTMLDHYGIAHD